MKKNRSLAVVSEDSLITKIIKSLKNFLKVKQDNKEEVINRRAMVIQEEKIERRLKRSITNADLSQMDEKISKDISYINSLNDKSKNTAKKSGFIYEEPYDKIPNSEKWGIKK